MIELINAGDRDILREATRSSTVFWYRARERVLLSSGVIALTVLLLIAIAATALGPEGTGISYLTRERLGPAVALLGISWFTYTGWAFFKLLPGRNDRVVLSLRNWLRANVDPLEEKAKALSDDQMRAKREELSSKIRNGASPDDVRAEAYALVREASRRARNHRHFECQLIGGNIIERCNVAEMRTGEGKTIVCYAANYMKVLQGMKVHMVTVNDYLVKRDAEFCRPIFELLGVSVGYISAEMGTWGEEAKPRQAAYACDVTYGTNSEFGFDYLRDNMKMRTADQAQGRLDFTVVDEVDSILIDEARTPLIISGEAQDDTRVYMVADNVAQMLIRKQQQANRDTAKRIDELEKNPPPESKGDPKFRDGIKKFRSDPFWLSSDEGTAIGHLQYFVVEQDRKSAHMTEHGAKSAQQELGIGSFYDTRNMNWPHLIDNALRAHQCYQRDKDYVVEEDTIVIVDEFTGRKMVGRQWSDGLHQAVECKERVTVKKQTQTLATVTIQNFFKLYKQMAGMTGTALTEADEFMKIYKLEVIPVPTNKPIRRVDYNDKIYKNEEIKYGAIVAEIHSYCQKGYAAEAYTLYDQLNMARKRFARMLKEGKSNVAELKLDEVQSKIDIIDPALKAASATPDAAAAGMLEEAYLKVIGERVGGRPILVGTTSVEKSERLSTLLTRSHGIDHEVLNAKNHAREAEIVAKAGQQHLVTRGSDKFMQGNVTIATNMAGRGTDIVLGPGVAGFGGLHVIGTERHESRRIDNQLRGRCGRQGDPGSSRFFLSLEDDLLKLFMGEWMLKQLARFGMEENVPLEANQLSRGIKNAQKKVEERNFGIRKNLLEYDEVMDHQRRTFYGLRQQVLETRGLSGLVWEMIDEVVADAVDRYYNPKYAALVAAEWISQHLHVVVDAEKLDTVDFAILGSQAREAAEQEMKSYIQRSFGEYIDTENPPEEWDVPGVVQWASQYGITLTARQVKETHPDDLMHQILEAAVKKVDQTDLTGLEPLTNPDYARARLADWALDKFGVVVKVDDLARTPRDEAEQLIVERMREAYRVREREVPAAAVVAEAVRQYGQNVNAVCGVIAQWVKGKYGLQWTYESFQDKNPRQIFDELRGLNAKYLENGAFDAEIEAAIKAQGEATAVSEWARKRFGPAVDIVTREGEMEPRELLKRCGYEMLRWELTQIERDVMLRTLDDVWKDHMYSMDLLRGSISLRGYGERDPKIEYKREGTRLFNEMMSNIRARVTDVIFKIQPPIPETFGSGGQAAGPGRGPGTGPLPSAVTIGGPPPGMGGMVAQKADATGSGFRQEPPEGLQKQGEGTLQKTIKRDVPKVGRNDPCPCGSGKKYKQCHGKTVA